MTRPAHLDSAHLCSPTLTRRGRPRPARAPAPNSSTPDSPASQKKKKESALDQAGTLAARRTQPADHRPLWPAVLLPQRQRLPRNTAYLYPPPAPRRPPRKATARNAPLGPASQKKRHLPTGQPVKRGCPPHRPARRWRRTQKQSQPITEPHAAGGPSASPGARWLGKATAEGIRAGSGTQITDPARRAAPPRGCTALHCQTPPFAPASNAGPRTSTKSACLGCDRSPCAPCMLTRCSASTVGGRAARLQAHRGTPRPSVRHGSTCQPTGVKGAPEL